MDTQYRIYEQLTDGRCYVAYAYVDPLGIASYSWAGSPKLARLFDSAAMAEHVAGAIERTVAERFGTQLKLVIIPATGGHSKTRGRQPSIGAMP